LSYGEYVINKSSVSEWHRRFKEGREDEHLTQEGGSQERKGQKQMLTEYEPLKNLMNFPLL
jgi:hypothetical protein